MKSKKGFQITEVPSLVVVLLVIAIVNSLTLAKGQIGRWRNNIDANTRNANKRNLCVQHHRRRIGSTRQFV